MSLYGRTETKSVVGASGGYVALPQAVLDPRRTHRTVDKATLRLGHYLLINPTTNNNKAAPAVAVTIEPINPPIEIPRNPNTEPPMTAPIIPTTMLPSRPKPPPFIKLPASQPATAPIAR